MSRTISNTAAAAAHAQQTGEVFLVLLELTHASLAEPIRVVNNTQNITHDGDVFIAYPFDILLPSDEEHTPSRSQLRIDNVSRDIVKSLRFVDTPINLNFKVILASTPDVVEAEFQGYQLRNVTYNAFSIQGELTLEEFLFEPYPANDFTPSDFPAMFGTLPGVGAP